jgi:hypothetical protein
MKTLGEKAAARLRHLRQAKSSWHGPVLQPGDSVSCIEEESSGYRLRLELDDADKLSLQARALQVSKSTASTPAQFDADRLRRQADEVARRVTYLTEKIRLVELDQHNHTAQLRSVSPMHDKDGMSYFEILLSGNHALSLRRYQMSEQGTSSQRVGVAFVISQELFERLVDDFIEALEVA